MLVLCANWAKGRERSLAEIFQKDLGDMPRSLSGSQTSQVTTNKFHFPKLGII